MDEEKPGRPIHRSDRLENVRPGPPELSASLLKDGEKQDATQRIGNTVISLALLSASLFAGSGAIDNFREGDTVLGVLYCFGVLFFLYFGARGLKKSFRFTKTTKDNSCD